MAPTSTIPVVSLCRLNCLFLQRIFAVAQIAIRLLGSEVMEMTLTNKDIATLRGIFATKQDLEQFMTKVEFNDFKNIVMINFDKLFKMFETWRDENAIAVHKVYKHDQTLENHENRLRTLESAHPSK